MFSCSWCDLVGLFVYEKPAFQPDRFMWEISVKLKQILTIAGTKK